MSVLLQCAQKLLVDATEAAVGQHRDHISFTELWNQVGHDAIGNARGALCRCPPQKRFVATSTNV